MIPTYRTRCILSSDKRILSSNEALLVGNSEDRMEKQLLRIERLIWLSWERILALSRLALFVRRSQPRFFGLSVVNFIRGPNRPEITCRQAFTG